MKYFYDEEGNQYRGEVVRKTKNTISLKLEGVRGDLGGQKVLTIRKKAALGHLYGRPTYFPKV